MNVKKAVFIACAIAMLPLFPEDARTLRTEFQDVPPKFIVKDGVASGISFEIMKLIERKSGFTFDYVTKMVPIARVCRNLEIGAMDIQFGLQKTPERERVMVFGPSLYTVRIIGVMRKDDTDTVTSISDLVARKETVLTQNGTGAAAALRDIPGLIVDDATTSVDANLQKLIAGRGKILIYHNLTLNYVIAASKFANQLRLVELDFGGNENFTDVNQYLVYSPKVPKSVMENINRAIAEAKASGELQRITEKYLK